MEQSVRLLLFGGLADAVDATKLLLLLVSSWSCSSSNSSVPHPIIAHINAIV